MSTKNAKMAHYKELMEINNYIHMLYNIQEQPAPTKTNKKNSPLPQKQ